MEEANGAFYEDPFASSQVIDTDTVFPIIRPDEVDLYKIIK